MHVPFGTQSHTQASSASQWPLAEGGSPIMQSWELFCEYLDKMIPSDIAIANSLFNALLEVKTFQT